MSHKAGIGGLHGLLIRLGAAATGSLNSPVKILVLGIDQRERVLVLMIRGRIFPVLFG